MEGGLYMLFYRCKWSKYLLTFMYLKARLAEKKALVSGQGKAHEAKENEKKNHSFTIFTDGVYLSECGTLQ